MKLKINDSYYEYFDAFSISTTLAAVASTFAFAARFDPNNLVHRKLFKPLSYSKVEAYDEVDGKDKLLSTGTLLNTDVDSAASASLIQVSGYSTSGIIEDCDIPYKNYPLEFNGLTLKQIAEKLCGLLGVRVIVYDSVAKECNEKIEKTVARPEQKIKDYLSKIAAQKNVVISHDIYGNLILFRPVISNTPKLFITPDNTVSMKLSVNGQNMHSELTSIRQPQKSGDDSNVFKNSYNNLPEFGATENTFKVESVSTVNNPLIGLYRPSVDVLSSGTFYNTLTAARNRRAAELQNIQISFTLNYWPAISVGDVIEVQNQGMFIFKRAKMILSSTVISQDKDSKTFSGNLVLPETFTGGEPKTIFDD